MDKAPAETKEEEKEPEHQGKATQFISLPSISFSSRMVSKEDAIDFTTYCVLGNGIHHACSRDLCESL
jgi:hypothetical protein